VLRYGTPIEEAPVRHRLPSGITYSGAFEEYEACVAAGLDLQRWEEGSYAPRFKARVIAWHRLHGLVEGHIEDAAATQAEKQRRHAERKRK